MFPNNFPISKSTATWSVFYASAGATLTEGWRTWQKPVGSSFLFGWMCGGAGGGGKNSNGAQVFSVGGGSSGGSLTFFLPACFLPDIMFIRAGAGGAGAVTAGATGGNGIASYISFQPNTSAALAVCSGGNGSVGSGTTGGSGPNETTSSYLSGFSYYYTTQSGGSGASGANGSGGNSGYADYYPISGGAGGGCGTGLGGALVSADPNLPTFPSAGLGGNGANGYGYNRNIILPEVSKVITSQLVFSGGCGGGGHTTGQAGRGGNGGYGCGGGGGGSASSAGGLSGNGGNGGDGLIILGAF